MLFDCLGLLHVCPRIQNLSGAGRRSKVEHVLFDCLNLLHVCPGVLPFQNLFGAGRVVSKVEHVLFGCLGPLHVCPRIQNLSGAGRRSKVEHVLVDCLNLLHVCPGVLLFKS